MSSQGVVPVRPYHERRRDGSARDLYKVLVVGDSGIGKTNLIARYTGEAFSREHVSTIGIDFRLKTVVTTPDSVSSTTATTPSIIRLHLWDSAGQERFRSVTNMYYRDAHGVVCCYDITDRITFKNLGFWIDSARTMCRHENVPIVIVGMKSDLESKRAVSVEESRRFAESRNLTLYEISAKAYPFDETMFDALIEKMRERFDSERANDQGSGSMESRKLSSTQRKFSSQHHQCCTIS